MANPIDQKEHVSSKYILYLGCGSLLLFFIYIFAVTFMKVPLENKGYVDIIIGFLSGTIASTVINFYFGNSNVSKSKDKTITDLQDANDSMNANTITTTTVCPDPAVHSTTTTFVTSSPSTGDLMGSNEG